MPTPTDTASTARRQVHLETLGTIPMTATASDENRADWPNFRTTGSPICSKLTEAFEHTIEQDRYIAVGELFGTAAGMPASYRARRPGSPCRAE